MKCISDNIKLFSFFWWHVQLRVMGIVVQSHNFKLLDLKSDLLKKCWVPFKKYNTYNAFMSIYKVK